MFSKSTQEHKTHLDIVFNKLKAANLTLNKKKCRLFAKEIKILGNVISEGIVKLDPEKIEAIREYKRPTTIKELRSFLGLTNYCKEFIPAYAQTSVPLYNLFRGEIKRSIKIYTGSYRQFRHSKN